MKRYGMSIRIKPEFIEEYLALHRYPDPKLIAVLDESNIRNNTVFLSENLLFNYFEYYGTDFEADWKKYTESDIVRDLFRKMQGFFLPVGQAFPAKGWNEMKEVFRKD